MELLRWARGAFVRTKNHSDNCTDNNETTKKSHLNRHNDDLDNYIENRVRLMVDAYKESLKQELEMHKKELEQEFGKRLSIVLNNSHSQTANNKMVASTTATAYTATNLAPIIAETLTSSSSSQLQSQFKPGNHPDVVADVAASIQPRVAAATVVSSTIATVVATAVSLAAATAQCNSLNQQNDERSLNS